MSKASLQFKEYQVIETYYKKIPFAQHTTDDQKIVPDFTYRLDIDPENVNRATIELGISIGDESLGTSQYFISAKILGLFEIVGEIDEESRPSYYRLNAVAILYPYLRSLVSDLTGKGNERPVILPTMNIVRMMNEYEKKEKEKKSGNE